MIVHDGERLRPISAEELEGETGPAPRLSLQEFTSEAGKAIRLNLPREVWVEATLLDVSAIRSGYILDLVEPHASNPSTCAQLRCFMPSEVFERVREATGDTLELKALRGSCAQLKIAPTFHPSRHLQGKVLDLEPTFAPGFLEPMLEEARLQLMREGILQRQRQLPAPVDILRIGVIHPQRSAGYADILPELEKLERSGIATSVSFPATFEGAGARQSLCAALKQAGEVARGEGLDILLLVRGGGHSSGLVSLMFEDVARLICTFPAPVITGLGHATDRTLLDEAAWRSSDTPSKAIGLVLALLRDRADRVMIDYHMIRKNIDQTLRRQSQDLLAMRDQILRNVETHIRHQEYEIESARQSIATGQAFLQTRLTETRQDLDRLRCELTGGQGAKDQSRDALSIPHTCSRGLFRSVLEREGRELPRLRQEISQSLKQVLEHASLTLDGVHREVRALSLEGTLARGFALVLDHARRPVRHVAQVGAGPLILILADGAVTVRSYELAPSTI
jgi:exodeoxyribonuclease VII large subunit